MRNSSGGSVGVAGEVWVMLSLNPHPLETEGGAPVRTLEIGR